MRAHVPQALPFRPAQEFFRSKHSALAQLLFQSQKVHNRHRKSALTCSFPLWAYEAGREVLEVCRDRTRLRRRPLLLRAYQRASLCNRRFVRRGVNGRTPPVVMGYHDWDITRQFVKISSDPIHMKKGLITVVCLQLLLL